MSNKYLLYNKWIEVKYIRRKNRFVMEFDNDGKKISAYVPNTGRMTEFRFRGHPFYLAHRKSKKFDYRLVSTKYQDAYVLLDTIKVNDIFHEILKRELLDEFKGIKKIRREFTINDSRFDFLLTDNAGKKILVEIKSCTLCHNGVAMFPDAPTARGRKHIRQLHQLAQDDYKTYVYYLVLNNNAKYFIPDFHIDYKYGVNFKNSNNVNFRAIRLNIKDPVTVDFDSTSEIPVENSIVNRHCTRKGSYVLVLENRSDAEYKIGALGKQKFQKGYYVYIGSAMNNLDKRISRHLRKRKKNFWHIDYLTGGGMEVIENYPIRRSDRIESALSNEIMILSNDSIKDFGASDTGDYSHLHYFTDNPVKNEKFYKLILDYMTSMDG